jgi:hypothetical protein
MSQLAKIKAREIRRLEIGDPILADELRKNLKAFGPPPPMNKLAQALGRLAKGKPKTYTKAELARRKARLALARAKRWPKQRPGQVAQ